MWPEVFEIKRWVWYSKYSHVIIMSTKWLQSLNYFSAVYEDGYCWCYDFHIDTSCWLAQEMPSSKLYKSWHTSNVQSLQVAMTQRLIFLWMSFYIFQHWFPVLAEVVCVHSLHCSPCAGVSPFSVCLHLYQGEYNNNNTKKKTCNFLWRLLVVHFDLMMR